MASNSLQTNGVPCPKTKPRPTADTLDVGHIAAIDFGTTCCSLAYCLKGDLKNIKEKAKIIKLDGENDRAPSAVLIDLEGSVIMFGCEAEDEWNRLCDKRRKKKDNYYFFKQIKMRLLREENITLTTTIEAANGKECFLIEVIAIMLRYIKDQLISYEMEGNHFGVTKASDFNWVITVPAIWKPKAKQLMREAAYMAGIASEGPVIKKLTAVERNWGGWKSIPRKVDRKMISPDQLLSLALEPEGAALYCMHSADKSDSVLSDLKSCLVADIGGGTVDISAITRSKGTTKIEVAQAPTGNDYGGTRVNQAIWEFLGKLVNDADFEQFKTTTHYASDMRDLEKQIESKKCEFGKLKADSTHKEIVIRLPSAFVETYSTPADDESDSDSEYSDPGSECTAVSVNARPLDLIADESGVTLNGRRLEISYGRMEEFFKPAVDAITSCIEECLDDPKVTFEAVFLVGGFGGCSYIYNKLKPAIERHCCSLYKSAQHTTAVVAGAVMFRHNPEIFSTRIANATYGTSCLINFNHEKYGHSYDYLVYDDDGVKNCCGLFSSMVTAGEKLQRDIILKNYVPGTHGMTSMGFEILASKQKDPYYAYTPNGSLMPGIEIIGTVQVSMPNLRGDKSRKVELIFDFSDTEIQVQAHDLTSGEKASTVVDFLEC